MQKKLPIAIQDFEELINSDCLYIDKTEQIYHLIQGKGSFLSRPRRFGKSLLLSTFDALFSGKRHLFKGFWIDQTSYDWREYPVISLDFSRIYSSSIEQLIRSLNDLLIDVANSYEIPLKADSNPGRTFTQLIQKLSEKERVVILIDEYDRPMIDNINDPKFCRQVTKVMHDFFIVIKSLGKLIRFAFVTGVSNFSRVSLFSGMNNLPDISLYPQYATLTGITEKELHHNYDQLIKQFAKKSSASEQSIKEKMKAWYNGYRFCRDVKKEKVFNPVSIHLLFERGEFADFWFSTATPTFALDILKKHNYPLMNFEEGASIGLELEESHDVEKIDLLKLLYQTGYLTISDYDENKMTYLLKYPNEEVRRSFLKHLIATFVSLQPTDLNPHFESMREDLIGNNFDQFFSRFNLLLAAIPYEIHIGKEAYYHSLLYLLVYALGFQVNAEVMTHQGRLDMSLELNHSVFLFEFKLNRSEKLALNQLYLKNYAKKFQNLKKEIILIGVNFDSKKREISDWISHEFH